MILLVLYGGTRVKAKCPSILEKAYSTTVSSSYNIYLFLTMSPYICYAEYIHAVCLSLWNKWKAYKYPMKKAY